MRAGAIAAALLVAAGGAQAERPVYRVLDERGGVTYSDRPAGFSSARIKNHQAPAPSYHGWRSSLIRADSERVYYERLRAEERLPAPIVVYDPRRDQAPAAAERVAAPRLLLRWDPNLPDAPGPSLERRYYYDGR